MASSRKLVRSFLFAYVATFAFAQKTVVVIEETSSALIYSHAFEWKEYTNPQALGDGTFDAAYWHGGSARAISIPGASVSLTFNGSRIAFYGDMNSDHGKLRAVVDGQATIVDAFRAAGSAKQVKLFEANLNGDIANHVITLTCIERLLVSFDYFEYDFTEPVSFVATTTQPPASQIQPALPTDNQQRVAAPDFGNKTPIIVTAVIAALGWLLVLLLGLFIIRSRNRKIDTSLDALPVHNASPGALANITSSMSPNVRENSGNFQLLRTSTERIGEKQKVFAAEVGCASCSSSGTSVSSVTGATTASTTRAKPAVVPGPNPPAYSDPA